MHRSVAAYPCVPPNCHRGPTLAASPLGKRLNGLRSTEEAAEQPPRLMDLRTRIREECEQPAESGEPLINITITLGHGLPDYVDADSGGL